MKKVLLIYVVLIAAIALVYFFVIKGGNSGGSGGPKLEAITVSQHSDEFNASVKTLMDSYFDLTEGFVNWDTVTVNKKARDVKTAIANINLNDLKKDEPIYLTAVGNAEGIKMTINLLDSVSTLKEKRGALDLLSDQLYDFLRIIKYDLSKVYLQECPMALNNYEESGNWLSKTEDVRNPYLGTSDPVHGNKMLSCGGPLDSLNYMITDTVQTK